MGKKMSQARRKYLKSKIEKKQRFNSLIKVLRSKVYITDSSSFKELVQELIGNGVPVSGQRSTPQIIDQVVPSLDFESSMEASTDNSFQPCNYLACADEESQANDPPFSEHFDHLASEYLSINQQEDSLVYGHLESCFQFEVEGYPQLLQQEVSIYDHELPGLI